MLQTINQLNMRFIINSLLVLIFPALVNGQQSSIVYLDSTIRESESFYWNGDDQLMISIGMALFEKEFLIYDYDETCRVWLFYSDAGKYQDVFFLTLFEFPLKGQGKKQATMYTLRFVKTSYNSYPSESDFRYKCKVLELNKKSFEPKSGWQVFLSKLRKDELDNIYAIKDDRQKIGSCEFVVLQYVTSSTVRSINYKASYFGDGEKGRQEIAFLKLIRLIEQEFGINLGESQNKSNLLYAGKPLILPVDSSFIIVPPPHTRLKPPSKPQR